MFVPLDPVRDVDATADVAAEGALDIEARNATVEDPSIDTVVPVQAAFAALGSAQDWRHDG
jgi:hypothetical protein